jgi:trehalose 6-phosphate phosphatase
MGGAMSGAGFESLALPPLPQRGDRWALYLDLDGTLAHLAPHPGQVRLEPELQALLARLGHRLDGALCILSGRPRQQLKALLGGVPSLCMVGSHGAEAPEGMPQAGDSRELDSMRAAVEADIADLPGVWIETKPFGFALHFRQQPSAADALRQRVAAHLPAYAGLRALEGACVIEIMLAGHDKGTALARLAASPRFRQRLPVVLGDDVTDEDAFVAAEALAGFGVCVGMRRPTAARYGLPCVTLTHTWLLTVADRLEAP